MDEMAEVWVSAEGAANWREASNKQELTMEYGVLVRKPFQAVYERRYSVVKKSFWTAPIQIEVSKNEKKS